VHLLVFTRVLIYNNKQNEKYVQYGAFVNGAMNFTDPCVIRSNSARQDLLFCETLRSHNGVEDHALSTGEGLQMFQWKVVPSSWTVGPEDEGKLTS